MTTEQNETSIHKKTMSVAAPRVTPVGSNGMALGSSESLMVSENVELLFNDFSAARVKRAFHYDVEHGAATATTLPKRWCVDTSDHPVTLADRKPYADCRGSRRKLNGHSRLHAVGVRLTDGNWLKAALKSDQISNH